MDQFDNIWGIITAAIMAVVPIVTLIVQATPTPKDDNIWGKIALVLGRIFSAKSFEGKDGKSKISVPIIQSAKPKDE